MLFSDLPTDILHEILRHLAASSPEAPLSIPQRCQLWCAVSSVNRQLFALCREQAQFALLQKAVASGQQAQVEQIMLLNPAMVLKQVAMLDFSGRIFPAMSPWQYAAWALDIHMLRALLRVLVTLEHRQLALQQLMDLSEVGTPYSSEYDFLPLIGCLQILALQYHTTTPSVRLAWWISMVGQLQRTLPAHVAQEYCRLDRAFYPVPTFAEANLPRRLGFFVREEGRYLQWFEAEGPQSRLGRDFAISRGGWIAPSQLHGMVAEEYGAVAHLSVPSPSTLFSDARALLNLWARRRAQLTLLVEDLSSSLQPTAGSPAA